MESAACGGRIGHGLCFSPSILVLGWPTWRAFFQNFPSTMKLLEEGALPLNKMVTVFSALCSAGAGFQVALGVHGTIMLSVVATVFW